MILKDFVSKYVYLNTLIQLQTEVKIDDDEWLFMICFPKNNSEVESSFSNCEVIESKNNHSETIIIVIKPDSQIKSIEDFTKWIEEKTKNFYSEFTFYGEEKYRLFKGEV